MEGIKKLVFDFLTNYMLIAAGLSWFTAQMLKAFTGVFKQKDFSVIELFFGTGGMPSSHSAVVSSLACAAALSRGLYSAEFAICVVLALIVMRDASGMRNEVGKHAKILNNIFRDLALSKDTETQDKALKELVGHTAPQVFVGSVLGIVISMLLYWLPFSNAWFFGA